MLNLDDFGADNQEQQNANVAIKITVPKGIADDLNLYAQSIGKSKTEIVNGAVEQMFLNDPKWQARLFFFEKNEKTDKNSLLESLSSAPKGTLLKVAALYKDTPDSARICICNLIKVRGSQVSFDIPQNFRPTHLNNIDYTPVKLSDGHMVLPYADEYMAGTLPMTRWIYTVDVKYIWDIDCNIPIFS